MVVAAPTFAATPSPTAPLDAYLKQPDGFAWKQTAQSGNVTTIQLTSQNWHGIPWKHQLRIYWPQKLLFPGRAVVQLTTTSFPWDDIFGRIAADSIGAPFVSVYGVPNQPLWGKKEDNLFGYTLEKMFETSDPTWSLAFPMAKSATRALDAVQSWSKARKTPISRFIVIGFSKRGLAAWLASADPRVMGLVSIGYNNLNVEKQGPNQFKEWGEYSPHLRAYTQHGLLEKTATPAGKKLMATWDPYWLLDRINKPKFLMDATNNGFWTLDALDLYASAVRGQTNVFYIANASHYMENAIPDVFGAAGAWCRAVLQNKPLPTMKLQKAGENGHSMLATRPLRAFFTPLPPKNDFREATFTEIPMTRGANGLFSASIPAPPAETPVVAIFGQGTWSEKLALKMTSRVKIGRL